MFNDFGGNITTNGTDTNGTNISPSQAGYGDALTLPVHTRGTATNSFSIGLFFLINGESKILNNSPPKVLT